MPLRDWTRMIGRRSRGRANTPSGGPAPNAPIGIWPPAIVAAQRGAPLPATETSDSTNLSAPPAPEPATGTPRLPYLGGLDGLRALAVIAVVLYHAGLDFMPAGFLGVEIFFVISGYLITSLLLAERAGRTGVSLRRFWQRRARRLLPALFVLVAAVLVYFAIFLPDEVATIRGDALASIGYITNWAFIFEDASYFEQVGRPSPLLHLWSLGIEEQFYLFWPLVFVALTWIGGRRLLLAGIVLGAIGSTWLMAALFEPFSDVSRIYYGTDTRAAGLLIGAALAVFWRAGALPAPRGSALNWMWEATGLKRVLPLGLDLAGLAALGGLTYIVVTFSEFQPSLYQGGFAIVSTLTATVIAATVVPGGLLGRALGIAPLRAIGLRSYSIYLWHWPIFVVTRPDLDVSMGETELLLVRLALTLALSEISYRLVEMPIRHGGLGQLGERLRNSQRPQWRRKLQRSAVVFPALGGAVVLGVVVAGAERADEPDFLNGNTVATAQPATADESAGPNATEVAQSGPSVPRPALEDSPTSSTSDRTDGTSAVRTVAPTAPPPAGSISARFGVGLAPEAIPSPASGPGSDEPDLDTSVTVASLPGQDAEVGRMESASEPAPDAAESSVAESAAAEAPDAEAGPPPPEPFQYIAIGDSVMLGAAAAMQETIGGIGVDAEVSRHADPAISVLTGYLDQGLVGDVVILHIGNNGPMYAEQFDTIMGLLGDRTVFFLSVRVPRQWQDWTNDVIHAGVAAYDNAFLLDWFGASEGKSEWFWSDGYHLRPDGAANYASFILAHLPG